MQVDKKLTKDVKGRTVEFIHDPLETGKNIKLAFFIKNAIPEQYLGALGHVVIIDDKVENFIHVHPISQNETVFEPNSIRKEFISFGLNLNLLKKSLLIHTLSKLSNMRNSKK